MCEGLGPAAGLLLRPGKRAAGPGDARRRCGSGAAAHPGPTRRRQATGAAARSPQGCARPCLAVLVASRGPAWLRRPLRRRRREGEGEEVSGRDPQERAEGCVISGGLKNGPGWKIA